MRFLGFSAHCLVPVSWDGARAGSNLIRSEVHPMEEAQGFRGLLDLEDPKYSIEQIAAKVGKSPVFVASRLKLADLVPAAVDAFYADQIGVDHALLLAKLPADQQEAALSACFKEVNNGGSKPLASFYPSETCNSGSTAISCWS